jgi:hypothetical protein
MPYYDSCSMEITCLQHKLTQVDSLTRCNLMVPGSTLVTSSLLTLTLFVVYICSNR